MPELWVSELEAFRGLVNDPSNPYENGRYEVWSITPPEGKYVKLWFDRFNTESRYDGLAIASEGVFDFFSLYRY